MTGALLTAATVDEAGGTRCADVDIVTGAICTRRIHVKDEMHFFEDQDFKITWPPQRPPLVTS